MKNKLDIIDYQSLLDEYNNSLINTLRGFRPKYEFLEMWVPDSDSLKSVINLIESAQISGEKEVHLSLNADLLNKNEVNEIESEFSIKSNVHVTMENSCYLVSVTDMQQDENDNKKNEDMKIGEIYKERIDYYSNRQNHNNTLHDDELLVLHSTKDGISLFIAVDNNHVIREAAYAGTSSNELNGLLEALCTLIDGLPIQEMNDHGLIKLEFDLRDKSKKLGVPGISNVFNLDKIFNLPRLLIDNLYKKYCKAVDLQPSDNFYSPQMSKMWCEVNDDDRVGLLQSNIDEALIELDISDVKIHVVYIDKLVKVHVNIENDNNKKDLGKLLMMVEKILREQIEPLIELYLVPYKDINKLRETKLKKTN
jgi:hypothetical protein